MKKIIAYKGFDKNMQCRGFQYQIGKKYKHDGDVKACSSGFHACENPLDVLSYYDPANSLFAICELSGKIDKESGGDSKIAAEKIHIKAKLDVAGFVKASFDYMSKKFADNKESNSGNRSMASNTGYYSMASNSGDYSMASNTGYYSMASNSGNRSMASNTGNHSMASNSGNRSMASNSGNRSMASNTGNQSMASNSGNRSMASNTGYHSMASNSGDYSMASNTGYHSMASNSGNRSMVEIYGNSKESVAVSCGYACAAKASSGNWIVLAYRGENMEILHIKSAKAGREVKADVWYSLSEKGEFIEVENENK